MRGGGRRLIVADAAHEEGDVPLDICGEILHGREELRSGGDVDGAIHLEVAMQTKIAMQTP